MSIYTPQESLNVFCTLGNVLKELSEPAGAVIYTSKFKVSFSLQELCVEVAYKYKY